MKEFNKTLYIKSHETRLRIILKLKTVTVKCSFLFKQLVVVDVIKTLIRSVNL